MHKSHFNHQKELGAHISTSRCLHLQTTIAVPHLTLRLSAKPHNQPMYGLRCSYKKVYLGIVWFSILCTCTDLPLTHVCTGSSLNSGPRPVWEVLPLLCHLVQVLTGTWHGSQPAPATLHAAAAAAAGRAKHIKVSFEKLLLPSGLCKQSCLD